MYAHLCLHGIVLILGSVTGPSLEDDDDQAALRAERARVAAVDISWIMEESRKPFFVRQNKARIFMPLTVLRLVLSPVQTLTRSFLSSPTSQ